MDGIIILVILYFLFSAIVKRARQGAQPTRRNGRPGSTAAPEPEPVVKKPKAAAKKPEKSVHQPVIPPVQAKPYTPITPMISVDQTVQGYTGSIGGISQEGTASAEGIRSSQGFASNEGVTTTEGGEVFSTDVLYSNHYAYNVSDSSLPVLPDRWDRNTLVQAVVMKEILDRPRWRTQHGRS